MKKTILLSALAFGALTSAALAEPVALSDAQLDTVTAGQARNDSTVTVTQTANAIGGSAENTSAVEVRQEANSISLGGGDDGEE